MQKTKMKIEFTPIGSAGGERFYTVWLDGAVVGDLIFSRDYTNIWWSRLGDAFAFTSDGYHTGFEVRVWREFHKWNGSYSIFESKLPFLLAWGDYWAAQE